VQALYFGLAAIVVGFGVYTIWGEQLFPSESTKSSAKEKAKSLTGQAKQKLYSPKGGTSSSSAMPKGKADKCRPPVVVRG
jgi:hypothetical protein